MADEVHAHAHAHAHAHGHHHHHHHHLPPSEAGDGRLVLAVAVNVGLTAVQVVGGVLSGSLSLVADALHNLGDAGSLVVALFARRVARRPADERRTFGYRRVEVIGALINLTALVVVGGYLMLEAVQRLFSPQPIDGWVVVWIACVALAVDLATAWLTYRMAKGSLNMRAAFVHNVTDALASVGVIVAGTLILTLGWVWADLVATLLISAYVIYHGVTMMRDSARILLDSVPPDLALDDVAGALAALPDVDHVHHLHVRQLDEQHRALEAHLVLSRLDVDTTALKRGARALLAERFRIGHTTLELELPHEREDCGNQVAVPDCFDEPTGAQRSGHAG